MSSENQAPEGAQWKAGNEFLPYHPQASHVSPDYRDGWNACYRAALAAQPSLDLRDDVIETLRGELADLRALCDERGRRLYGDEAQAPAEGDAAPEAITADEGAAECIAGLERLFSGSAHPQPKGMEATGDVWLKHDDDLRFVARVLSGGLQAPEADIKAARDIVHGLRTTARSHAQAPAPAPGEGQQ